MSDQDDVCPDCRKRNTKLLTTPQHNAHECYDCGRIYHPSRLTGDLCNRCGRPRYRSDKPVFGTDDGWCFACREEDQKMARDAQDWRKWTGACSAGRPKWVENFSPRCIFAQRAVAEKTIERGGSRYFTSEASTKTERFRLTNITVEEVR